MQYPLRFISIHLLHLFHSHHLLPPPTACSVSVTLRMLSPPLPCRPPHPALVLYPFGGGHSHPFLKEEAAQEGPISLISLVRQETYPSSDTSLALRLNPAPPCSCLCLSSARGRAALELGDQFGLEREDLEVLLWPQVQAALSDSGVVGVELQKDGSQVLNRACGWLFL